MSYKNWNKETSIKKLGDMMLEAVNDGEYEISAEISNKMTELNSKELERLEKEISQSISNFEEMIKK